MNRKFNKCYGQLFHQYQIIEQSKTKQTTTYVDGIHACATILNNLF